MNMLPEKLKDTVTPLPSPKGLPERFHKFDERSISAVNAALAARRPLLVRGEPGVGKTQLAEAVAVELKRAFYPFTVDARTESRDLLELFLNKGWGKLYPKKQRRQQTDGTTNQGRASAESFNRIVAR